MKRRTWFYLITGALGVAFGLGSFLGSEPRLIWNFSASAPAGLYLVTDRPWTKGDRVAVKPDLNLSEMLVGYHTVEPDQLLIKRIAAAAGDEVCRTGAEVLINGSFAVRAKSASSQGRVLPSWQGCRLLRRGEVFLLGDAEKSFDGRYFGPISSEQILAPLHHIG